MNRADFDRAYQTHISDLERRAPALAEGLLDKYKTIGRALNAARWKYSGYLQYLVVERLQALWTSQSCQEPRTARSTGRKPSSRSPTAP